MYIFISLPTTNNNNKLTGYKVPGGRKDPDFVE